MVRGGEPGALPPGTHSTCTISSVAGGSSQHALYSGHAPEYKACWDEPPTTEEMAQMERLLQEIADLSAWSLMGAAVAISFCRRLTQPIQERVHPAFEYWGHRDPTRGHERKVPRDEITNRVACIMAGQIWDKGCPKAHYLKRPTDAVSLLEPCRVVIHPNGCTRKHRAKIEETTRNK